MVINFQNVYSNLITKENTDVTGILNKKKRRFKKMTGNLRKKSISSIRKLSAASRKSTRKLRRKAIASGKKLRRRAKITIIKGRRKAIKAGRKIL